MEVRSTNAVKVIVGSVCGGDGGTVVCVSTVASSEWRSWWACDGSERNSQAEFLS